MIKDAVVEDLEDEFDVVDGYVRCSCCSRRSRNDFDVVEVVERWI